ncbi:MAG: YfiR/HmsC family protein, partial [Colwellia sp.]|nr:YfiR/HmsC family protein [Colwellia sp.]
KNTPALTIDNGKAHYIIQVIKHITWPNEADITQFNIVILGNDKKLVDALNNKADSVIRGKSISVQQFNDLAEINTAPEAIFVVNQKSASLTAIINKKYPNTLIIGNGSAIKEELMIGLLVAKNVIKLSLNLELIGKQGFKISNGLLDFAGTKADFKKQLIDKETTLTKALNDAKVKEAQLKKLNASLANTKTALQKTQSDLDKQNDQLFQIQAELASLKNSRNAIKQELMARKHDLLAQQTLITEKEQEQQRQQQKLLQLKSAIAENEQKLQLQIKELEQQNTIIERKEQKISGQQKLLYITIALALIILLLKFIVLRVSKNRKAANEELAHLNEQLYELATQDDMTKLYNRRHFLELAQRELSQLQRTKGAGAVLMIDIDHFKNINDSYGHAAGDQAIINVANILKDNLREYDMVGRLGGEEFAMFLPNCEIEIATKIAERMRVKIASLSTSYQQTSIKLTVSIGLTAKRADETNIDNIIQRADKALYQAKNSGRDRVVAL